MASTSATLLTTENERNILLGFAPGANAEAMENGVDTQYFDGKPRLAADAQGRFIAFVGTMDYHPNIEAVRWFARQVFPILRRRIPGLNFLVVGRNPVNAVRRLESMDGVRILGGVPDVRPNVASASALVAPLRLARGIQNKVLEALAMGREVFASSEVCRTFGDNLPAGVVQCSSVAEYVRRIAAACQERPSCSPGRFGRVRANGSTGTGTLQPSAGNWTPF